MALSQSRAFAPLHCGTLALIAAFFGPLPVATANIVSSSTGGNWSATSTWVGNAVPTASDDVVIAPGAIVTINTAAVAQSLNVGTKTGSPAILVWETSAAKSLTVGGFVHINAMGTFEAGNTGNITNHTLSVGGDLTNDGVLDFRVNTAAATITFTGASNATFGGAGSRTNIQSITVDKGNSNANTLELNPANFLVQGHNSDGPWMAFLTLTNGTFKLSGTFTLTGRVFSSAGYGFPSSTGFWLNNPNFTVAAQNGNATVAGFLRISQGTFNLGTDAGNQLSYSTNGSVIVEGGAMNIASGMAWSSNNVSYNQSAGVVTLKTVAGSSSAAIFFPATNFSSFIMSGGAINVVQAGGVYLNAQTVSATNGNLTLGSSDTAPGSVFKLQGNIPSLVIDGTTNPKEVDMDPGATSNIPLNLLGTLTIGATSSFVLDGTCNVNASPFTNNGILDGTSGGILHFQGTAPQIYNGTGTVTPPFNVLEIDNINGLVLDPTVNLVTVNQVAFINGGLTNSNRLQLGNGGTTPVTVAYGTTNTVGTPGTFDVAPSFNYGTGGENLSYFGIPGPHTIGPELTPTRVVNTLLVNSFDLGFPQSIILSGGDLVVTGGVNIAAGIFVTGSNTLVVDKGATYSAQGQVGFVDGGLRQSFATAQTRTFDVGTAVAGYLGVSVNKTNTGEATITVHSHSTPQPNYPGISLARYWTITTGPTSVFADLTFNYEDHDTGRVDGAHCIAAVYGGGVFTAEPSSPNQATRSLTVSGANALNGDWLLLNPDADFDGMPDSFETANGLNPNDPKDANGDLDGDGVSNLDEYLTETDPKNANSVFRITAVTQPLANNVVVTFSSVSGSTYRLEYKNALTDATWQSLPIADYIASSTIGQITDSSANSFARFYHVRIVLP